MRIILILLCCLCLIGATVVERDKITGDVLCSYDTASTNDEVNIDKTRDVYVNGILQDQTLILTDKEKIAALEARLAKAETDITALNVSRVN